MTAPAAAREGGKLAYGVAAIADHFGITRRQANHWIETGRLTCVFRVGRIVCAKRSDLDLWLAEQEAAARKAKA